MIHALHPLLIALLLHRLTLTSSVAEKSPLMSSSSSCSEKLVTFSTCLPYVAVSPNNLTDSPPPQCCDNISSDFVDGSAICLCYLVLRPDILGFPLNSTKLLSLTSVCLLKDQTSTANFSLRTLCSRSAALPPLGSITGSRNPTLPNFGAKNSTPAPPLVSSAQGSFSTDEAAHGLPSQPSLSTIPTIISSGNQVMYTLSWTWLTLHIIFFVYKIRG